MVNKKNINKLNLICILTIIYFLLSSYSYTMFIFTFMFIIINGILVLSFITHNYITTYKLSTYVYIILAYTAVMVPNLLVSYNFLKKYMFLINGCFNRKN